MDKSLEYKYITDRRTCSGRPFDGSQWWRASDYEIVGGTHIAPTPSAELEVYDPLQEQQKYWGGQRNREEVAPYIELARLDLYDDQELLNWCRRYGLLGIFHQQTLEAYAWPYWDDFQGPQAMRTLKPYQLRVERGGRYRVTVAEFASPPWSFLDHDGHVGEPLTRDQLDAALEARVSVWGDIREPGARIGRIWDGTSSVEGPVPGLVQFFPRVEGVSEWTHWHASHHFAMRSLFRPEISRQRASEIEENLQVTRLPLPDTEDFLRGYGEPIHLFREWAIQLGQVVGFWVEARSAANSKELQAALSETVSQTDDEMPLSFRTVLESVSQGVRFEPSDEKGPWKRSWRVPSLFAAMNVMLLQEAPLGDARILHCVACGKPFATNQYNAEYCSERCRRRINQRKFRAGQENLSDS